MNFNMTITPETMREMEEKLAELKPYKPQIDAWAATNQMPPGPVSDAIRHFRMGPEYGFLTAGGDLEAATRTLIEKTDIMLQWARETFDAPRQQEERVGETSCSEMLSNAFKQYEDRNRQGGRDD
jgi:hypothetical protein